MRKTLLVFLTILFIPPMLAGCFYPYYIDDWHGRGHRHNGGHHEDRGYDDQRGGHRDYRDRR